MNKKEALEALDGYEDDFEAIGTILEDSSLTPSEKVSAIEEVVQEDEEDEDEPDEIEEEN